MGKETDIDVPKQKILEMMESLIKEGAHCYPKWTCRRCGERVTATEPNTFYESYRHDECGAIYDGDMFGLMVVISQEGVPSID